MNFKSSVLRHLIPIGVFLIIAGIYFAPLFSGKVLVQSDNVQMTGTGKEIADYREKGESISWNPREFSGLPLTGSSVYNPFTILNKVVFYGVIPKPMAMSLVMFVGFYLLMVVLGANSWVSAIGALAYAFSSFNMISIEVGHDNKVIAMALMAPVLAGVIAAYKGEWLKGGVLTCISAGFQLYYGHVQITYYLLFMVLGYVILVLFNTYKSGEWSAFIKASAILTLATLIGFGCNFSKLYAMLEYKDYSTRGGTELKRTADEQSNPDGLSKDYALSWSYGKMEMFTLIFPYFHGGGSGEELSKKSETYKALTSHGVDRQSSQNFIKAVSLYWGDQPFTGGTIYFGAIVCVLFILSFVVLRGGLRWWALGLVLLSLLLAMGKNLEWFTDIFFYNVPLYNKFRTVTMIFAIAQLVFPLMAFLAVDQLLMRDSISQDLISKGIKIAGIVVVIGLVFIVFKSSFFDFEGARDGAYNFPDWLLDAIRSDRKRLFTQDIIRSIVFVVLALVVIWFKVKKSWKLTYVLSALGVLVLIDLWGVDRRYLSSEDFKNPKRAHDQVFQPSAADQQILKDKSYFRVMNLVAANPFSDGVTSYFHYSILGYSAIKMQRYQELIDRYIGKMHLPVLNMLNTKYLIRKGEKSPVAQKNPDALGNAWFIQTVRMVDDADQELETLGEINLDKEAVVDKRFKSRLSNTQFSGIGSVSLENYHPEHMTYNFRSEEDQVVVFSEIFYEPGWNVYVDGQVKDYFRANYVLRGLEVPKGDHKIEFIYEPVSQVVGVKIIVISTVLLVLFLFGLLFQLWKSSKVSNS